MEHTIVNVLDHGADPAGVRESTAAFRDALRLSRRIEVPRGVYLLSGLLELEVEPEEELYRGEDGKKKLYGDGNHKVSRGLAHRL